MILQNKTVEIEFNDIDADTLNVLYGRVWWDMTHEQIRDDLTNTMESHIWEMFWDVFKDTWFMKDVSDVWRYDKIITQEYIDWRNWYFASLNR